MLKRESHNVFYELDSGTSPNFFLKYKHLIINNLSGDTITVRTSGRIFTIVEPNAVKQLFDLFESKDISEKAGIKCTIESTGVNSKVYIDNFGV